jgi:hypothetical protein
MAQQDYYYNQVLKNPTATAEAKAEANSYFTKYPAGKEVGGSLGGTMTEKVLPESKTDNLSAFRNVLASVTQRYKQTQDIGGMSTAMNTLGVANSPMSGRSLANIVNFVKNSGTGIKDIYTSTVDFIDKQKETADNQLQTLITSGGIANSTDDDLVKLSALTDYPVEYLKSIREAKKKTASGDKETEAEFNRRAIADMAAHLTGVDKDGNAIQGADGYISPDNYKEFKAKCVATGLNPEIFDEAFSYLRNPANPNYGD